MQLDDYIFIMIVHKVVKPFQFVSYIAAHCLVFHGNDCSHLILVISDLIKQQVSCYRRAKYKNDNILYT